MRRGAAHCLQIQFTPLLIIRSDLEHHLTLCSSAILFKQQEERKPVKEHKPADNTAALADSDEEDWDREMEGLNLGTYNPMEKVVKGNIPVNAHLMNKSGRRDLRSMQRMGDLAGVAQVVNGYDEGGPSQGSGHLPVGMSETVVKKKKNKKKKKKDVM